MATVAVVVLASFSPAQLQSRTQIVFAPRVCTLVLFHSQIIRISFPSDYICISLTDVYEYCVIVVVPVLLMWLLVSISITSSIAAVYIIIGTPDMCCACVKPFD